MKDKGKDKTDDPQGKGKAKGKDKKGKETRVCHECNKPGHLRKDCSVYNKTNCRERKQRESRDISRCDVLNVGVH